MVIYYSPDVAHVAVAQFKHVSIGNFLELIRFGEVLVDKGEETFSYVDCYVLTVRGGLNHVMFLGRFLGIYCICGVSL